MGLVPGFPDLGGAFSFLIWTSSLLGGSSFALLGRSNTCISSGEQILHVQLLGSPDSSVASHNTWGKKSAGLL